VEWDKENHSITLPIGAYIDFGGIVKGWCVEQLAKQYIQNVHGIIINLGGDIAAFGNDLYTKKFQMSIWNPITKKEISMKIHNEVLCTSGTYKRYWGNYHHIIDPFILSSSQSDLLSASIIHKNGGICEAIATACIIWGKEKSINFLEQEKISYLLIEKTGEIMQNI
jgi:thiamine biosynthesis lipoprotein